MMHIWIIVYAIVIHLAWGLTLLIQGVPLHTTAIDSMFRMFPNARLAGIIYILIAVGAIVAVCRKPSLKTVVLILPQQYFLMMSALGAIVCIVNSAFADGVVRSRAFIFVDQLPIVVATVLHTFALIEIYAYDSLMRFIGVFKK